MKHSPPATNWFYLLVHLLGDVRLLVFLCLRQQVARKKGQDRDSETEKQFIPQVLLP